MANDLNISAGDAEKRAKTEKVLTNIYSLPAISEIMYEASRMLDDPTTSTSDLARLIGRDQGLSSRILSIANSSLYGLPRKVATIDFALLVIGYKDTKNIVIALSLMEAFKNKNDANLNYKNVWIHSYSVGGVARKLSTDLGFRFSGEAFVAGLLHDFAIPVIHKYLHGAFVSIIDSVNNDNKPFLEAEAQHLGMTHQEIGRFLGERWNLPTSLCDVLLYHHTPELSKEFCDLASIVHVADYAVNLTNSSNIVWDKDLKLSPAACERLKITEEEVLKFINDFKPTLEQEIQVIKY